MERLLLKEEGICSLDVQKGRYELDTKLFFLFFSCLRNHPETKIALFNLLVDLNKSITPRSETTERFFFFFFFKCCDKIHYGGSKSDQVQNWPFLNTSKGSIIWEEVLRRFNIVHVMYIWYTPMFGHSKCIKQRWLQELPGWMLLRA